MKEKHQGEHAAVDSPMIPANQALPEITPRVIILGTILTIILAAANAYLGLKVGTTVSASIPAAVISMGILRFFRNSNILENTMVQTMASVGEALTAGIAFILPALIIQGVWEGFPYWLTVLTGLLGGVIGVLFSIPLRRALLRDQTLTYPEGLAIGNVLKASVNRETKDLRSIFIGGIIGGLITLFQTGFQIFSDSLPLWFRWKKIIVGLGFGFSPALIAAGYIIGINVALSVLLGIIFGWLIGVPSLSWLEGLPLDMSATASASFIWKAHIRYIGVGCMLIGGLWTLCTLIKPVMNSLLASFVSLKQMKLSGKAEEIPRTERDLPIHWVLGALILLILPLFFFVANCIIPHQLGLSLGFRYFISGFSVIYIIGGGFIFCSIMAYFAGLIGSTNSPVSGMLVCALLVFALILLALFNSQVGLAHVGGKALLGSVVSIGSMVIIGASLSISNDTMQDLKVGQLVGATPWKQQLMLLLGVIVASFAVPLILQLLYTAYGIGGVFPRPHMNPAQMLAAPQAGLMAAVAKGVFEKQLEWKMIVLGCLLATICVVIDELLKKRGRRLPVLAVGLGIYLPLESSTPVVIGGLLSFLVSVRLNQLYPRVSQQLKQLGAREHRGLLLACGLVAGASLMGVILALPFALKESSDALRLMPAGYQNLAYFLGAASTVGLCIWMYRVVLKN